MKKVAQLKESELHEIIKSVLNERVGVPDNILEESENIYNIILEKLEFLSKTEVEIPEDGFETEINGDFRISDFEFSTIKLLIVYNKTDRIDRIVIGSMSAGHLSLVDFDTMRVTYDLPGKTIMLRIDFHYPETAHPQRVILDSYLILRDDSSEYMSSLAHELQHAYTYYKHKGTTAFKMADYQLGSEGHGIQGFNSINKFIHNFYYVNLYESLVRPTEIASLMQQKEITKSQFAEFLQNNEVYRRLKEIRDYKPQDFFNEFRNDMLSNPETQKLLSQFPSEQEIYNKLLSNAFGIIAKARITEFMNFLKKALEIKQFDAFRRQDAVDLVKLMTGYYHMKADAATRKYKDYALGDINSRNFFEKFIKIFNFAADKIMKKLSKLYDMAKDDTNQTDIHSKVNRNFEKMKDVSLDEIKNMSIKDTYDELKIEEAIKAKKPKKF